jgi:hypothetical protein
LNSFIAGNGLINLEPELAALEVCVKEYGLLCECDSVEARTSKYNQCKGLYIAFVSKSRSHKAALLSKASDGHIIFTIDGQQIATLNR